MTKFRKACNKVLTVLVTQIQPLMDKYYNITSGPQNNYSKNEAGKLADRVDKFKSIAQEEAEDAYEAYIERLEKKIKSFSGGTIDEGDIQILNSPIMVMSPDEYDLMCERYEGNRAMERLLIAYSEKHEDQAYADHFLTDEKKKELAYKIYNELIGWISNNHGFGVSDYVLECAGDMFAQADLLKE